MTLFWRRGYAGTSTSDLVEHLGVNKLSLYAEFCHRAGGRRCGHSGGCRGLFRQVAVSLPMGTGKRTVKGRGQRRCRGRGRSRLDHDDIDRVVRVDAGTGRPRIFAANRPCGAASPEHPASCGRPERGRMMAAPVRGAAGSTSRAGLRSADFAGGAGRIRQLGSGHRLQRGPGRCCLGGNVRGAPCGRH